MFDGLLRSKVFSYSLFPKIQQGIAEGIRRQRQQGRNLFVVGLAKSSKVLNRYRLVMKIEDILTQSYPCYVKVPKEFESNSYVWNDHRYIGDSQSPEGKNAMGKLYFVKFGRRSGDPIWPVDILVDQDQDVDKIMGCLLADAEIGFPVAFYPRCLQRAHENAALVDFEMDMIQDQIFSGIRSALGPKSAVLDIFRMEDEQPARKRYR